MKTIITWAAAFVTLAGLAYAGIPQTINYQGYLKNSATGAPVNTATSVTFRLYSTGTPLNPLWSGTPKSVTPVNGIYSTQIGPVALPFDRQYWLGVTIAGTEITPLQPLYSVPYALSAPLPATSTYTSSGNAFEISNRGSGAAIKGIGSTGNYGTLGGTAGVTGSSGDYYSGVLGQNSANGAAVEGFSSGSGAAVLGHTSGTGKAGMFTIENASNADSALYASTVGTGSAGRFYSSNSSASGSTLFAGSNGRNHALEVTQSGIGNAGYFSATSALNNFPAIFATANGGGSTMQVDAGGTGMAGSFNQTNSLSNALTLYTSNSGTGGVINGTSFGSGSIAVADFSVNNPAGSQSVLKSTTNGLGRAGEFRITNSSNTNAALYVHHGGMGTGLDVIANGTGGSAANVAVNNISNSYNALHASHVGSGATIASQNTGTGSAGSFTISNPASVSNALSVSTNGSGAAVSGTSASGYGVQGFSASSVGVVGTSSTNTGIWGIADGGTGVDGMSTSGIGVVGRSGAGYGVVGTTGNNIAVYGVNSSKEAPAVEGWSQGGGDIFRGWSGQDGKQELKFSVANNGAIFTAGGIAFPDGSAQVTAKRDCAGGRYEDNGDGTVSDCRTGLIWLKNANCNDTAGGIVKNSGYLSWADAGTWAAGLGSGICDLADNSNFGDWRMPTKTEWMAMVASARKQGFTNPVMTNSSGTAKWTQGYPFDNVQVGYSLYWSSSTYGLSTGWAWVVHMSDGNMVNNSKSVSLYVWPVRSGQ